MHDSIVECIADSTEKWEKTLFFGGGFLPSLDVCNSRSIKDIIMYF